MGIGGAVVMRDQRLNWPAVVVGDGGVASLGALPLYSLPHGRDLILFGLYAVPSHMLISPFPIEPPLLYMAKVYSPMIVGVLAASGRRDAGMSGSAGRQRPTWRTSLPRSA